MCENPDSLGCNFSRYGQDEVAEVSTTKCVKLGITYFVIFKLLKLLKLFSLSGSFLFY